MTDKPNKYKFVATYEGEKDVAVIESPSKNDGEIKRKIEEVSKAHGIDFDAEKLSLTLIGAIEGDGTTNYVIYPKDIAKRPPGLAEEILASIGRITSEDLIKLATDAGLMDQDRNPWQQAMQGTPSRWDDVNSPMKPFSHTAHRLMEALGVFSPFTIQPKFKGALSDGELQLAARRFLSGLQHVSVCPKCGAPNEPQINKCGRCGADIYKKIKR